MHLTDTIIATSSPPTPTGGGIRAIIRLSGPDAWTLIRKLVELPEAAEVGYHGPLAIPLLHPTLKLVSVLLFKAPRSFTGEDIAELHLPNSPALLRACIDHLLERSQGNARLAGPGEFSARAFFNGKIDLTEAEGIAATINATTELELRAAASLREGQLHKEIARFADRIAGMLALVEAGIDFSDEEDVSFNSIDGGALDQLRIGLQYLLTCAVRVDRTNQPPTVVFIGKPNVGKSSLINILCGENRSITSPIAGTTRDMLSATMPTIFGDVRIVDVPGEEEPLDELRNKMMAAREAALLEADLIINVLANEGEVVSGLSVSARFGADSFTVQNKIDLLPPAEVRTFEFLAESANFMTFRGEWQMVSAKTGRNIGLLREEIGKMVYRKTTISPHLPALNQRHRAILQQCKTAISEAEDLIDFEQNIPLHPELLAADLRRALDLLGQITGTIFPDDILGRIFSQFCIGK